MSLSQGETAFIDDFLCYKVKLKEKNLKHEKSERDSL